MNVLPRPPWTGLGKKLEGAVRKALYSFSLLDNVSKIAVAVSGGKDSMTLLFLLHAISGKGFPPFEIVCLHVDGEFGCGANIGKELLVSACKELQIPLFSQPMSGKPSSCYTCARKRRSLLFDMARHEGCSTIAFGHHRDDNVQTLLMNLCHKGEFAGMLPKIDMIKYGVTIIRPLILIEEKLIKAFAQHYGFLRRVCQCPIGTNSLRKRIDIAIDSLEALYPHVRANLARSALEYGSKKALSIEPFKR
jgi:tRNA(Ile)-lysidine synthase TilS/MesJ